MNAGPEALHEHGHKNECQDGNAARTPDPTGTEQRVEPSSISGYEGQGGGALPAPSGIICLCVIAGRHQCAADPVQLTRALGLNPSSPVTDTQILLAAKELGLKAKRAHTSWETLPRRSPIVAEHDIGHEAGFLERIGGARDFLAIQHPGFGFPQVMMRLPRGLALRGVDNLPDSRQGAAFPLSQEHEVVSWLSTEMTRQVEILAGKVLVRK